MSNPNEHGSKTSSLELIERVRAGDEEASAQLFRCYIERLVRIIGGKIPKSMQARVHAEDVVQSVFRTVFRRLKDGEFEFVADNDIWKLLVTIGIRKTHNQTSRNLSEKRSIAREVRFDDLAGDEPLLQRLAAEPSITDVLALRETMDTLFSRLDTDDAKLIEMRLEGYSQSEIGGRLELSDRQIRRRLKSIRESVVSVFEDSDSDV